MAKLTRVTGKLFGGTATATGEDPQIGQFGSAKAGTYNGTTDVATIQSLSAWSNGWIDAVTPTHQFPTLPEMTGVHKVLSYQENYLLQQGMPEWDSGTTYYTNSFCSYNGTIYKSLTDNNLNHNPSTSTTQWTVYGAITDYANHDLSNLTATGENRLHALKGYEDAGELLTDSEGLIDVTNYAHSTFDASKYDTTGVPIADNNGIAYNFTSGNYYKVIITTGQNNFDIVTRFYYTAAGTAQNVWYIGDYYNLTISTSNEIQLRLPNDNNSWYRQVLTYTPSQEGWIWIRYSVQGGTTYAYTSENGAQWTPRGNVVTYSYQYLTNAVISIGATSSLTFADKLDLKNFYVNVAGKTVFSGNQTGVDIVKPDSYTVTGSPSVTSDGVASGFSASNYIQTFNSDLFANPFELYFGFNSTDVTTRETIIGMQTGFGLNIAIKDSKLLFGASSNGTSLDIASNVSSTSTITTNTFYLGRFKWTGSSYTIALYINGEWTDYITVSSTSAIIGNQSVNIGLINSVYPYANGEIDLNAYKLYVDNNLVYQACLKVPYAISSTGSMIVDSALRFRVSDMYNQFGYAPYYTLSDSDFTLPQGEIYGMINRAVVKKSWTDGYSWYRIYNDNWIEQGGLSAIGSTEQSWGQPTLTGSAPVGGSAFGVESNSEVGLNYVWHLFDNNANTVWVGLSNSNPSFTFYNPTAIKAKKITLTNYIAAYVPTGGTVQGSNDNSTWTSIKNWTNSTTTAGASWDIDLSTNSNSYKYYKVTVTSVYNSGVYVYLTKCNITASITISTTNEIAFFQNFSNDRYSYTLTPQNASGGAYYVSAKSVSGLTINSPSATQYSWTACGY